MLLFKTRFPLSKDIQLADIVQLFQEEIPLDLWSALDLTQSVNLLEQEIEFTDRVEKWTVGWVDTRFGVECIRQRRDDNVQSQFIYMVDCQEAAPEMFVSVSMEFLRSRQADMVWNHSYIPKVVKQMFWMEYVGDDNGLPVDDHVIWMRRKNAKDLFAKIVQGDYLQPVVYVSSMEQTENHLIAYPVDPDKLAQMLCGMAHVVVEANPCVRNVISGSVKSKLPKEGGSFIRFADGDMHVFGPDTGQLEDVIVDTIRSVLTNVTVPEQFQFSRMRYECMLQQLRSSSGDHDEMISLCDTMLAEKDKELDALKQELYHVNAKATNLQTYVDSLKEESRPGILFEVSEHDLYPNEIKDVVLKVLEKEYKAIASDKSAGKSRKAFVLKSLLEHNEQSGTDAEIKAAFRKCMKNGTLDSSRLSDLEKLGFSVDKSGKEHYKVVFAGDSRCQTSMAITPSDFRSGDNLVASYMNQLFGF